MKKILMALLMLVLPQIVLANQNPTASQVATNCTPWNKNLNCTMTNQQLVDNAVDQLSYISSVLPLTLSGNNVGIGSSSPGTALDVNGTIRGLGINVISVGSSTTSPSIIGFGPSLILGNAVQMQMGDNHSGIQTGYGDRMQLMSYWGTEIRGHTESSSPPSFVTGVSTDASMSVFSPIKGNTVNFVNNTGSMTNAVVDANGNIGIGSTVPMDALDIENHSACLNGVCNSSFAIGSLYKNKYLRGANMGELQSGSYLAYAGATYTIPSDNDFKYAASKGLNLIRLPFQWEFLQPTSNAALDSTYQASIDQAITSAKKYGIKIILDCHNFGKRWVNTPGGMMGAEYLRYPYADFVSGGVVLRDNGDSYYGDPQDPVSPATGYILSYGMTFQSKDASVGNEGLYTKVMRSSIGGNSYYEFAAILATGTWTLKKNVSGVVTTLDSGSYAWNLTDKYSVTIDAGQTTPSTISVVVVDTNTSTTVVNTSQSMDAAVTTGWEDFLAQEVHVKIDTSGTYNLTLNVNGDTSSGGPITHTLGDGTVNPSDVADLWSRIATHYVNEYTVYGYDIMNEPQSTTHQITTNYLLGSTADVTVMYADVIPAIRAIDTKKWIAVESDAYGGAGNIGPFSNGYQVWWSDPSHRTMFSFHYYFDGGPGTYTGNWNSTQSAAIPTDVEKVMSFGEANNIPIWAGEYGIPNGTNANDILWQADLDTFLSHLDAHPNTLATAWSFFLPGSGNILNMSPDSTYKIDKPFIPIYEKHLGYAILDNPTYADQAGNIGGILSASNGNISVTSNVGIGSVNPQAALDVNGTVRQTSLYDSGAAIILGNVGVGSVNPDQTLSVNGTGRIAGTNQLYFGSDLNAFLSASQATTPDLVVSTKNNPDTSTGGTVTFSGPNTVRTFTGSGTFTPNFTGNVNVLVVAGGGGGGYNAGGGGGAGGVTNNTSYAVTSASPITVTIGAGGTTGTNGHRAGFNGSNSVFGSITTTGGGGGGSYLSGNGQNGGSGGGASTSVSAGTGTGGQGNNGGTNTSGESGGGGGGCGAVGANGTSASAGNGGNGCSYSISGTSTYYAGGGGGTADFNPTAGNGGLGGGGNGAVASSGNAGGNATGYGSGGGGGNATGTNGEGSGGIVILSYPTPLANETARFADTGNIGIGSATPGQALDVNGTVRMTYFSMPTGASNTYILTSDANGNGTWQVAGAGSQSPWGGTIDAASNKLINVGNVGIGSTAPGQALDVQGTIRMTGFNFSSGAGSNKVWTSDGSGNGSWQIAGAGSNYWSLATGGNLGIGTASAGVGIGTTFGNAGLTVMNGNVGIGTWNPLELLQVSGNVGIGTNAPNLHALEIGNEAFIVNSGGSMTMVGTLTDGSFNVTNAGAITGKSISLANGGSATFIKDTDTNSGSPLNISGGTASDGVLNLSSSTSGSAGIDSINFEVKNFGTLVEKISDNTGNPTVNFSNSNVGIGTTTPSGTLDVEGTVNPVVFGGISAGSTFKNVGIGSFMPGQKLDVQGTIRATSYQGPGGATPFNGNCGTTAVTSITVDHGIITSCTGV